MLDSRKASDAKADMRKLLAYGCVVNLEAYKVVYRSTSCLLVLSATDQKGTPIVCFIEGRDEESAFSLLWDGCNTTSHKLTWKPDKYRK